MKAEAALVGPENVIVLDAISLEDLHLTRVQLDREMDDDLVLRFGENRPEVGWKLHQLGGLLHVALDDFEELVDSGVSRHARGALGNGGTIRSIGHDQAPCFEVITMTAGYMTAGPWGKEDLAVRGGEER